MSKCFLEFHENYALWAKFTQTQKENFANHEINYNKVTFIFGTHLFHDNAHLGQIMFNFPDFLKAQK